MVRWLTACTTTVFHVLGILKLLRLVNIVTEVFTRQPAVAKLAVQDHTELTADLIDNCCVY